jgi:bacterioferritin
MKKVDNKKVINLLNRIMELELAGVVHYTHYALMVYGFNRIPITSWLKEQAQESLNHAERAGVLITQMGGHPSLSIGPLLETHKHDIGDILRESLEHEANTRKVYYDLLNIVKGKSILLEEYARDLIVLEEMHEDEVNKMLRKPGDLGVYTP